MKVLERSLVRALMQHFVDSSYYSQEIVGQIDEMVEIIYQNDLLMSTIETILIRSDFEHTHRVDKQYLKPELNIIEHYIEFIYYTSDAFLGGINESRHTI
jgi:hypothetical protein